MYFNHFFTYLCSIIFLCNPNFELEINRLFTHSSDVNINSVLESSQSIEKPAGTWIVLIENKVKCLTYKTPFKEGLGILKIVEMNKGECQIDQNSSFTLSNIQKLSGYYNKKANEFSFQMTIQDQTKKYTIPLLNKVVNKKFERFDSNIDNVYFKNLLLEEYTAQAPIKDGELCYGVNSSCSTVVANKCASCENGFYEVIDFNCPGGGSRYCGANKCGQKNEPACPRGYEILESKLSSLCFDGSPAGYCAPGLHTYCNEDKILICL